MKSLEKTIDYFHGRDSFSAQQLLGGVLLLTALALCYGGVMLRLARQWWANDIYSYGFLIPWISLYLAWARRDVLVTLSPTPSYVLGTLVSLAGLSLLLIGEAAGIGVLQGLSLIVTLAGGTLLLFGRPYLRILWFPIVYLVFMVPVWGVITERLHLPFQLFSAGIGVKLIHLIGIPAYQHSVYIELPNIILKVAEACSGVNYLVAVTAIAIPMAYLFLDGWHRRIVLFGFAVTVAIFSNILRVAVIGALAYYGVGGSLHGPFHILQGLSVSVIGYAAIFAGVYVLSRGRTPRARGTQGAPSVSAEPQTTASAKGVAYAALGFAAMLMLAGWHLHVYQRESVPPKAGFEQFPFHLVGWVGRDAPPDQPALRALGSDHELSRVYRDPMGGSLQLYVGYFAYQRQGRELGNDSLHKLHRNAALRPVRIESGATIEVNQLIEEQGERRKVTLFWYEIGGRTVADWYGAKFATAMGALIHGRSNGAVVMVTTGPVLPDELPGLLSRTDTFIGEMMPMLSHHLPS